ncbi:hypothetical protein [uncultured Lacinutrix sp.]|uniref:hypothetical protein n=1 Tax=uncultured Lacinutrix sp. TaxID=574032 RepID=UPI002616F058|nr:hypothetical protein [uncultured Lacinutrix sp.]
MAKKGSAKNTKNKAKHTKLMNRKKNKIRQEKIAHKERLRAIVTRAKNKNIE